MFPTMREVHGKPNKEVREFKKNVDQLNPQHYYAENPSVTAVMQAT